MADIDLAQLDENRLQTLMSAERERFRERTPKSNELFERARGSLLGGVPMLWMRFWPGKYPLYVESARAARVVDVDGHEYVDFCLGDTGAMTGHAPDAVCNAIREQIPNGISHMLPTETAIPVGEELQRRFGLPNWYFTLTATDANRFAIKICRAITQRPKILVFNYCYHGTVDETFITLRPDGTAGSRPGAVGPPVDPNLTTKVVEFNDLDELEQALAPGDVACVLAEPAMTNMGIILPDSGFHDALRDLTRRTGTLLIIDETHTISAGPGGYTGAHDLDPDVLVIGKPIGSGVAAATFGVSADMAEQIVDRPRDEVDYMDTGGVGGTLAGNALSMAAMRATLEDVLTEEAFEWMIARTDQLTAGMREVITARSLPWHVTQLGARVEYLTQPNVPRNGSEAAEWKRWDIDAFMHLFALNRGVMLTPSHNMALTSPATSIEDVDLYTNVFDQATDALFD